MHKEIHGKGEVARHLSGNAVNVIVKLDDFHAVSASYIVVDQASNLIVEETPIEVFYDDPSVTVKVDGISNTLPEGSTKAMRTIELTCLSEDGQVFVTYESYMLLKATDLAVPTESLMNAREAQFLAFDTPNVHMYEESSSLEQRRALIEASRRIDSLNLDMRRIMGFNQAFSDFDWGHEKQRLKSISKEQFYDLDQYFLADLRLAILNEADDILGGSPVEEARKEGILSESVGESTNMYQVGRPVQSVIGQRAYRILAPYVDRSYKVSR